MAKIIGLCMSSPKEYMIENPFDFMTEFDKWFWFVKLHYFEGQVWFTADEIPIERCSW